jgi:hypothetical protein
MLDADLRLHLDGIAQRRHQVFVDQPAFAERLDGKPPCFGGAAIRPIELSGRKRAPSEPRQRFDHFRMHALLGAARQNNGVSTIQVRGSDSRADLGHDVDASGLLRRSRRAQDDHGGERRPDRFHDVPPLVTAPAWRRVQEDDAMADSRNRPGGEGDQPDGATSLETIVRRPAPSRLCDQPRGLRHASIRGRYPSDALFCRLCSQSPAAWRDPSTQIRDPLWPSCLLSEPYAALIGARTKPTSRAD